MDGQTDGRVDGRTKMDASINEQMEWHTNLFSRVHTTKKGQKLFDIQTEWQLYGQTC